MSTAYFDRFELEIPESAVQDCSHQGPCDEDVAYWAPKVSFPDPELIRAELKEYGAWDENQLLDEEENRSRLLWIAAGNIREERSNP